ISNLSTNVEDEGNQLSVVDERKRRRMKSNRESARRSRMRKQRHLDELWSQVLRLRTENNHLLDKLNHVTQSHDRIVQENEKLKDEASDLHQMLMDIQFCNIFTCISDFEDMSCNLTHLAAAST
ncbi:hypothetical protein M569_14683, partial [Genlisea aurea]